MGRKWRPPPTVPTKSSQPTSSSSTVVAQSQSWSGPLPPPTALAGYENLVTGAADRILTMAENNNAYLIDVETKLLEGRLMERRLGQVFGLIIALAGLSVSLFLAYTGHETTASVIGGATLLGMVSVFVVGRVFSSD